LIEAEAKGDSHGKSLSDARTRKELAHAEIAERENEIEKGQWCKLTDATEWIIATILVCKERLLCVGGELSGPLDAEQCELVDGKIREALHELGDPKSFMKLAKKYNAGDRAKMRMPRDDDKKPDDDSKGDDANA
jgi:hypothetical protein